MKEYDIFLKQRLTEGSIIVYSLPFRDGVSAVNRVVLRAMLSYFSLQKKIAVANQSALLSEIDEMLATVSEKIGDQVCLEASAALTIKYRNELEQAAMRLDIPAFTLFAQSFFALESQIGIKVSQPIAYAKSSLGDAQSAMAIVAKSLAEQKQVFDTIQNQTVFGANDLAFRKHDFESGSSAIGIDQTSPELLYRYTLAEIAAWIQSHPDDASAMNQAITALRNLVGTLPEGAVSDTVVAYIKEYTDGAIAALNIGDYAKAADLTAAIGRIAALEKDTHTHANKALLDTYDQTNEDLKDAVAKKHSHANKTELDKIVEGDKAKWDAAAAKAHEHANKTELDKIAEGDKANLDAVVAALTVGTF